MGQLPENELIEKGVIWKQSSSQILILYKAGLM